MSEILKFNGDETFIVFLYAQNFPSPRVIIYHHALSCLKILIMLKIKLIFHLIFLYAQDSTMLDFVGQSEPVLFIKSSSDVKQLLVFHP